MQPQGHAVNLDVSFPNAMPRGFVSKADLI